MDTSPLTAAMMVDFVIVVTAVEGLVLWFYHHRTGKGMAGKDFMPTLLSGLLLMIALRLHMAGASWMPTAALLAGAGAFHAIDLRRRWRPASRQPHAINPPS